MTLRAEADRHDRLLRRRLDEVVPRVMERAGIDCWVVAGREYNEDPVLATMLPATWINARRRTILVFSDFGRERAAISRYPVNDLFPSAWRPEEEPDQWRRLAAYLAERGPERIALDVSPVFALADGLTASEQRGLIAALGPDLRERTVAADALAIGWLETRLPEEVDDYRAACAAAHDLLRRALSPEAVAPSRTTTEDLEWWLRQQTADAGFGTWFHPSVSVQRAADDLFPGSFAAEHRTETIRPGDLVHIDFGIVRRGLHTDQQQHAYVLRPGETAAPESLSAGLAAGNRAQDLLMTEFAAGRTGNQILAAALAATAAAGLDATVYTHAIGLHGHAAGPTIGLWDQQDGVPGAGDYPLHPATAHSIELSVGVEVPEWGRCARIMLEEDAFFDGETVAFLDGRQTELWVI